MLNRSDQNITNTNNQHYYYYVDNNNTPTSYINQHKLSVNSSTSFAPPPIPPPLPSVQRTVMKYNYLYF